MKNERLNKNTIEKERDLDLEALDTNPKRFNSLVIMDDFFFKTKCSLHHGKYFNLHFSPLKQK